MQTHVHEANTPTIFVIFGITGDLAQTKIIPALFALYIKGLLPSQFQIIGFARRNLTHENIHDVLRPHLEKKVNVGDQIESFFKHVFYHQGHFDESVRYTALEETIEHMEKDFGVCTNKVLYLSVRPSHYEEVIAELDKTKLAHECSDGTGWTRILIEKPFGENSATAKELDQKLLHTFKEEQVFRVDHYLGKEGVRDIARFRFEDGTRESEWGKDGIEKITVNLLEDKDVDNRGAFYDAVGALRDVGQNHMLEVLAQVAMERPTDDTAEAVEVARAEVLRNLTLKEVVSRSQYEGFQSVVGVAKGSQTETFFHLVANVENEKWSGVPIHLISGKALDRGEANGVIHFKDGTQHIFVIQPHADDVPDAYEHVFFDAVIGDRKYFVSLDEIVYAWDFVAKVKGVMKVTELTYYEKGAGVGKVK